MKRLGLLDDDRSHRTGYYDEFYKRPREIFANLTSMIVGSYKTEAEFVQHYLPDLWKEYQGLFVK